MALFSFKRNLVGKILGRFNAQSRFENSSKRFEVPEIDPVDWNVEEFRRLLDEPLRLTNESVTYDDTTSDAGNSAFTEGESVKEESAEARHPNSDDHRLYSLAEGDALLQTKAGDDEILSPVATGDETYGDPSTITPNSQIEQSVEPELASSQANEGQLIGNARPVLVVNIEMALAARVDAVNEWVPTDHPEEKTAHPSLIDVESVTIVEAPFGLLEASSQEVRAPLEDDGPDVYPDNQPILGDVPSSCFPANETAYLPPSAPVASSTAPARNIVANRSGIPLDTLLQKSSEAYPADLGDHIALAGDAETDLVLPEASEAFHVLISVLNSETKSAIGGDPESEHFDPPAIYSAESALTVSAPPYAVSSTPAEEADADPIAGGYSPSAPEGGDDVSKLVSPGSDGLDSRDHPFARRSASSIGEVLPEESTALLSTFAVLSSIGTQKWDSLMLSDGEATKTVVQDPPIAEAIALPRLRSAPTSSAMEPVEAELALVQHVDKMRAVGITQPRAANAASDAEDLAWLSEASPHKAIFEENVWAAPADRERAIVLRWALRDIRAKRLGLFPLDQHVFQTLLDMGLAELSDGQPILTQAGSAAIAST